MSDYYAESSGASKESASTLAHPYAESTGNPYSEKSAVTNADSASDAVAQSEAFSSYQKNLSVEEPGSLMTDQKREAHDIPTAAEDYTFSFQPDTTVDTELLADFKQFALQKGMTKGDAQQVAQFYEHAVRKNTYEAQQQVVEQEADFRQQCQTDREIGGARFEESIAFATRAVEKFSTPGLTQVLHESGYGSHPEVVRLFVRIGKSLGEKSMPTGQSPSAASTLAELMYPSMKGV